MTLALIVGVGLWWGGVTFFLGNNDADRWWHYLTPLVWPIALPASFVAHRVRRRRFRRSLP